LNARYWRDASVIHPLTTSRLVFFSRK
jgi:hypothetical protein